MADTIDVLTLAEARTGLSTETGHTAKDAPLAAYITAVSRRLDELCGPIVIRTITDEVHSGGTKSLFLREYPVVSVTTITEYEDTTGTVLSVETNASKPSSAYLLDPATGIIHRRATGTSRDFSIGDRNVVVTYQAGRYANTAAVDERFKTAARLLLSHYWRREMAVGTVTYGGEVIPNLPGFGVPNVVMDLLAGELKAPTVA